MGDHLGRGSSACCVEYRVADWSTGSLAEGATGLDENRASEDAACISGQARDPSFDMPRLAASGAVPALTSLAS